MEGEIMDSRLVEIKAIQDSCLSAREKSEKVLFREMKEHQKVTNAKLDRIFEAINGNGKPGLKTKVEVLKNEIEGVKHDVSATDNKLAWLIGALISAGVIGGGAFAQFGGHL